MPTIKYINKFSGYENYRDITNMPVSSLAPGSQNVFVEDGAKLEPRAGMGYFGIPGTAGTQTNPYWTLAHRIHSKYDDFVNKIGTKVPVRVFYEGTTAKGDVIEAWLPIYVSGLPTINKKWYQITATTPTAPVVSAHRWYFAEWYDGIVSNQQAGSAPSQPELIFTYGGTKAGNWSGGYAPVVSTTPTTITTDKIWTEYGFIAAPEGANVIVVNVSGVPTEMVVTGGFGTNTITVTSTTGVVVDDLVFQNIYLQDKLLGKTTYDVCSTVNNQVYFIDWNQRNVFISWNRNQTTDIGNTIFNGTGLNDAILSLPAGLTGTDNINYKVNIFSATKPDTIFTGTGANALVFDYSGYTLPGTSNTYKVILQRIPNTVQTDHNMVTYGSATGPFAVGETITGTTSGNTAIISWDDLNGKLLVHFRSTNFLTPGEIITGSVSGSTAVVSADGIDVDSFRVLSYKVFKNNIEQVVAAPQIISTANIIQTQPYLVADGITFTIPINIIGSFGPIPVTNIGNFIFYNGQLQTGDTWEITVNGLVDYFQYAENNGPLSAPIAITGGVPQALGALGGTITFLNSTDHTVGDSWSATAVPTVIRGWSDFTYTNPDRLPGQGMVIVLDSNGWTMKPQESTMLINAAAGHFYDVTLKLSADLKSEAVEVKRLKSEPQNKILYPYLINYIKNQLTTISNEKTFDVLGRQKFLELQQSKTLSDIVRVDFATVDWVDADILYFKRKIFFCIPRTTSSGKGACIFIWDDYKKYWHSPMVFGKRIGLLSVIDDKLIGHSYEMNESYELFTGLNDLGMFPIKTRIIMPYDSAGNRYFEKSTSGIGFEGYILGSPVINWTVNAGVGGCEGQKHGTIKPFMCLPADKASLGKSSLGYHGLGNDPVDVIPHFFYIKPFDNMMFYQRNIEVSCDSMEQRWSLISLGTTIESGNINNVSITDPD